LSEHLEIRFRFYSGYNFNDALFCKFKCEIGHTRGAKPGDDWRAARSRVTKIAAPKAMDSSTAMQEAVERTEPEICVQEDQGRPKYAKDHMSAEPEDNCAKRPQKLEALSQRIEQQEDHKAATHDA
jgi:hypothetical protein